MSKGNFLAKLVVAGVLACGSAVAQQPTSQEGKPVQLKAELMQIDAVVTDKNNRPVTDLRKEDFVLLENGKPQEVSFFSFVDGRHGAVSHKPGPAEAPARSAVGPLMPQGATANTGRTAVFVIDDIHLSVDSFLKIRPILLSFIDREMSEDDQIALVTTSGGLGMLQQLGRNKSVVRRAIMRFMPKEEFTSVSPFPKELNEITANLIVRGDKEVLKLVEEEVGMKNDQFIEQAAENVVDNSGVRARQTFTTLTKVIHDLEKLGGRKSLFLVSDGFLSVGIGLTTLQDAERVTDAATRAGVLIYAIDGRGLLAPVPGGDASTSGTQGIAVIKDGFAGGKSDGQPYGVPFIDIKLRVQSQEIWEPQRILHTLAEDTGGRAYTQNLTLEELNHLFDDNAAFYVLAYYPEDGGRDGKFREIKLSIKGRNDLAVRTRKGYLALPPEAYAKPPLEKNEAVIKAISSVLPDPEARVSLATAFLYTPSSGAEKKSKGKTTALISAHFDASWVTLKEEAGRQTGEVEVNGFVYDIGGKLASGFSRTVKIQMRPRTQSLVEREGITYKDSVELPPGFYNLRVAVVDPETLKVGTATDWIEIPDVEKSKVEIGGLLQPIATTAEAERAITKEASNNTERIAYQVLRREWARNSTIDMVAIIYTRADPRHFKSQVSLLKNNRVVAEQAARTLPAPASPEQFGIPIGARLSLAGLPPGRYTLRVTVQGQDEKHASVRESLLSVW